MPELEELARLDLLDQYKAGGARLRALVAGLSLEQLRARPISGTWSMLEVLCHLADAESVFADRMKRILAEDQPVLPFADPQLFAPALVYCQRDPTLEIDLFDLTRRQMATILCAVPPECFARLGIHSHSGPCTLKQVLTKCVTHLEHHLVFMEQKREVLLQG